MSRSRCWLLLLLIGPCVPGCDRDDADSSRNASVPATQAAATAPVAWDKARHGLQSARSRLSAEYENAQVVAQARDFLRAVEGRDMEALKKICTAGGETAGDYAAILNDYYHAFAVENDQGPAAARARLAEDIAKPGLTPARLTALRGLDKYMEAKGSVRTREAAAWILIIALECKYPGYGGRAGELAAEQLGVIDPSTETDTPTTEPDAAPGVTPVPGKP